MTITRRSFVGGGFAALGFGPLYSGLLMSRQDRGLPALHAAELDTLIPELLGRLEVPGTSIAVVSRQGVEYERISTPKCSTPRP